MHFQVSPRSFAVFLLILFHRAFLFIIGQTYEIKTRNDLIEKTFTRGHSLILLIVQKAWLALVLQ